MTIYEQATQSPRDLAIILNKIFPDCSSCPAVADCMYSNSDELLSCVDRLERYVMKEII